jgi:hypothetical protein
MARRLVAVALVSLASCVALPVGSAAAKAPEVQYVGKLKGSSAFVAITRKGRSIRAYVCDGRPAITTLSVWFSDRLRDGDFRVTAAGVRLDASVNRRAASGTVLLADDRKFAFRAARVKRRGGLLERTDRIRGRSLHSGWIALPDRRVRGRVSISGTSFNGSTSTGPGIGQTSTVPPSDGSQLLSECEILRQDLKDLRKLLDVLQASKPLRPPAGATDDQLARYSASLSTWQSAVADTTRKIAAVEARISATCG